MVKRKFPTKSEFKAWWKGKRDIYRSPRSASCPLARYLQKHGEPGAEVYADTYIGGRYDEEIRLPKWAQQLVGQMDGKVVRGAINS